MKSAVGSDPVFFLSRNSFLFLFFFNVMKNSAVNDSDKL